MFSYAEAVTKGDDIQYRATLRELGKRTEENLYGARQQSAIEAIASDERVAEAVKHHYLHKTLKEHKHHPKSLDKIDNMNFVEAARTYYDIGDIVGTDAKKI